MGAGGTPIFFVSFSGNKTLLVQFLSGFRFSRNRTVKNVGTRPATLDGSIFKSSLNDAGKLKQVCKIIVGTSYLHVNPVHEGSRKFGGQKISRHKASEGQRYLPVLAIKGIEPSFTMIKAEGIFHIRPTVDCDGSKPEVFVLTRIENRSLSIPAFLKHSSLRGGEEE